MARQVLALIIRVHERSINRRHALKHILQTFAQIMTIPQTRILRHHDIDLDIQLVTRMVRLQALDALDRLREAHRQIQQDIALVSRSGGAAEVAHVLAGRVGPVEHDEEREEQAAEGVEPPDAQVETEEGKDDAEGVEDAVGDGVLGEGLHGGVLDEAAVEPATSFDDDGRDHDGDGGGPELDDIVVGPEERGQAFERDLEEGGAHDDGEDEHADRFEAAPADGVGVLVLARDEGGGDPDDGGGEEVERGVDKGGQDGEGGGQQDDDDFADQEEDVGR